jgi:hypothetical protein
MRDEVCVRRAMMVGADAKRAFSFFTRDARSLGAAYQMAQEEGTNDGPPIN